MFEEKLRSTISRKIGCPCMSTCPENKRALLQTGLGGYLSHFCIFIDVIARYMLVLTNAIRRLLIPWVHAIYMLIHARNSFMFDLDKVAGLLLPLPHNMTIHKNLPIKKNFICSILTLYRQIWMYPSTIDAATCFSLWLPAVYGVRESCQHNCRNNLHFTREDPIRNRRRNEASCDFVLTLLLNLSATNPIV